jgi:taurine dioxygenase
MTLNPHLSIEPLSDVLGADVSGVDWKQPVAADVIAGINEVFLEHHLVCLRSLPLTAREFARIGRYFGEPQLQLLRNDRNDEAPEVSVFDSTYKDAADKPADLRLERRSGWHTDDSYFARPAKATLLQALATPEIGGETRFCNVRAAYADLPDAMKRRLDDLRAVHCYDTMRAPARAQEQLAVEAAETADVVHPLIRTHEETGNTAIYFNSNRTDRIEGMDRVASDALLDEIHAHTTQMKYRYHHRWRVGDVLMWDNRSLIHSVNMDFPVCQPRIHQRILLKGTVPV